MAEGFLSSGGLGVVESIHIPTWASGSDADIVSMVDRADVNETILTDYWAIGDERSVNLAAMASTSGGVTVGETHAAQTVTLVIMNEGYKVKNVDNSHVHFVVGLKDSLNEKGYISTTSFDNNTSLWSGCPRRTWCNSVFYDAFPATLKPIFKLFKTKTMARSSVTTTNDRFALFAEKEIFGSRIKSDYEEAEQLNQITWYATSSNRIKQVNGSNFYWWERSVYSSGSSYYFCLVNNSGNGSSAQPVNTLGLAPFGCI